MQLSKTAFNLCSLYVLLVKNISKRRTNETKEILTVMIQLRKWSCVELLSFSVLQAWLVCGVQKEEITKQRLAGLAQNCALEITGLVVTVTTDARELQQRHVVCATNNWGQRESTKTTFRDCVLLLWETASQCKCLFV